MLADPARWMRYLSAMNRYMNLIHLNWRVLMLAWQGRWLNGHDLSKGYDEVAPTYDQTWLTHLQSVTNGLLDQLPAIPTGPILDLGCGTGHTTAHLARKYPQNRIEAMDISANMLAIAQQKTNSSQVEYFCGDMLPYLEQKPDASAGMVISAWALGYSNPARIVKEGIRVLRPGGCFAFVVNRLDTLGPVFKIMRECMARFPDRVNRALWPSFPKSWDKLKPIFEQHHCPPMWRKEDCIPLQLPKTEPLQWLLGTGILAGFDAVLPLRENGPVSTYFNRRLLETTEPIAHHYIAAVCGKG